MQNREIIVNFAVVKEIKHPEGFPFVNHPKR